MIVVGSVYRLITLIIVPESWNGRLNSLVRPAELKCPPCHHGLESHTNSHVSASLYGAVVLVSIPCPRLATVGAILVGLDYGVPDIKYHQKEMNSWEIHLEVRLQGVLVNESMNKSRCNQTMLASVSA